MVLITSKRPNSMNSHRWKMLASLLAGFTTLILAITILVVDPIRIVTRIYTRVTPDSTIYKFLQKDLGGVFVSVDVFNITNAERFLDGLDDKLKVEKVGPFTYSETRVHEDMSIDMEAGTLAYTPRLIKTLALNQSIGYPEDFNITMPNLPMLGLSSVISSFGTIPKMAFNILTRQVRSKPIVTIDAKSYLWGYEEPLINLAYSIAPGFINFEKIGVLDRLYDSSVSNHLVTSIKDETKMMIISRNGYKKLQRDVTLNPEKCKECDSFENSYEGLLYPALTPDTPIRIFRTGVCKIFDMVFQEQRVFNNSAVGYVYHLNDNFFTNGRIANGLLDISGCLHGLPVTISRPHFKGAHPKVYERIEGMNPESVKEETTIVIEPLMGMQMATYVQLQVNLALGDLSFNRQAKRFSNMLVPICTVEIRQEPLSADANDILRKLYVIAPIIVLSIQLTLIALSIGLFTYSFKLYLDNKNAQSHAILFPMIYNEKPPISEEPLLYGERIR